MRKTKALSKLASSLVDVLCVGVDILLSFLNESKVSSATLGAGNGDSLFEIAKPLGVATGQVRVNVPVGALARKLEEMIGVAHALEVHALARLGQSVRPLERLTTVSKRLATVLAVAHLNLLEDVGVGDLLPHRHAGTVTLHLLKVERSIVGRKRKRASLLNRRWLDSAARHLSSRAVRHGCFKVFTRNALGYRRFGLFQRTTSHLQVGSRSRQVDITLRQRALKRRHVASGLFFAKL